MSGEPLLRIRGMSKTFADTLVLADVALDVHAGEVVAVVGHNGSGKSTLVKILAGFHKSDPGCSVELGGAGEDSSGGQRVEERLHFVHQDLGLILGQSTIENLAIGKQWRGLRSISPIARKAERRRAAELVGRFGGSMDLDAPLSELLPAERTIVAIARSLDGWSRADNVLVLDEPTATLHRDETLRLLTAVRRVAGSGGGVLFISHRLDEVTALADRVVVLRDGRVVDEVARADLDEQQLVRMIVGRDDQERQQVRVEPTTGARPVVTAVDLIGPGVSRLDLQVRAGEIVGVAGLSGSGRDTVGALLAGVLVRSGGTVTVGSTPLRAGGVAAAIAAGVAYVPADRRRQGAVMELSVRENLTLPRLQPLRRRFRRLDRGAEQVEARRWADIVELRPPEPERRLDQFSGGNQQKVVLAKWLRNRPSLMVMDEPTQGVDVGAKAAIYRLLTDAAQSGVGLLICSSDEKELVSLCDRVIVLADGEQVAEFTGADITVESLVTHVIGGGPTAAPTRSAQRAEAS